MKYSFCFLLLILSQWSFAKTSLSESLVKHNRKNFARLQKVQSQLEFPTVREKICYDFTVDYLSEYICNKAPNFSPGRHTVCTTHVSSDLAYITCMYEQDLTNEEIRGCYYNTPDFFKEVSCLYKKKDLKNLEDVMNVFKNEYDLDLEIDEESWSGEDSSSLSEQPQGHEI